MTRVVTRFGPDVMVESFIAPIVLQCLMPVADHIGPHPWTAPQAGIQFPTILRSLSEQLQQPHETSLSDRAQT
jgi:hypothetical protein